MTSISSSASANGKPGTPAVDELIGRVLDGRFRILSPIARGGMGAVYKAEQAPLGRVVALKIMSPRNDEAGNAEFRRRFFLEASTAAKLTHPNTVRVFDYGQTEDGFFFIAMEFLEGRTLKKVIAEEGALEPARAAEIAKQVSRSLREAHRMGIVHRDIKPGNIMLVERGGEELAKVLDFGLAKDTTAQPTDPDDVTQTGVFLGSPKYVSPEQVQGEPLDARSDVYSLGVVLYEMLTGAPPFAFEQPMQVLMAHVRDAPPELAAPAGKTPIPPELATAVRCALSKRREERWPDMEAFLLAIKEGLGGGGSISRDLLLSLTGERDVRSGVHSLSSSGQDLLATTTSSSGAVLNATAVSTTLPSESVPLETPPAAVTTAAGGSSSRAPILALGAVCLVALGAVGAWAVLGGLVGSGPSVVTPPPAASTPAAPALGTSGGPMPVVFGSTSTETAPLPPVTPPPAVPDPAPPRSVILALRSTPPGAAASLGERELGATPAEVELLGELAEPGRELEIVFRLSGFRSTTVRATVEGARLDVEARLPRVARPGGAGSSGGAAAEGEGDDEREIRVEGYRDSPY